jgi:hypothetical protein
MVAPVTEGAERPDPHNVTGTLSWLLRHPEVEPHGVAADQVQRARRAAGKASRTFNNESGPANGAGR